MEILKWSLRLYEMIKSTLKMIVLRQKWFEFQFKLESGVIVW